MLSKALKELVEDGFATKEVFPEVPPKVEYTITERGQRAVVMIDVLRNYGFDLMKEFGISDK